jgi:hypothetical protein
VLTSAQRTYTEADRLGRGLEGGGVADGHGLGEAAAVRASPSIRAVASASTSKAVPTPLTPAAISTVARTVTTSGRSSRRTTRERLRTAAP